MLIRLADNRRRGLSGTILMTIFMTNLYYGLKGPGFSPLRCGLRLRQSSLKSLGFASFRKPSFHSSYLENTSFTGMNDRHVSVCAPLLRVDSIMGRGANEWIGRQRLIQLVA
jgi:hypothetical protein